MSSRLSSASRGPFVAEQLSDGDRYELSNGHPILCAPAGRDHAACSAMGARALASDPDVEWAGIDAGFSPEPGELRAPDIALGRVAEPPSGGKGWIPGAPPLAVEYAGRGQDEKELCSKIGELLAAGTRWVWVVRLIGPRRVEVHAPGVAPRVLGAGEQLEAPGVLRNPVPVEALFDRNAADRVALRNLLQRYGYDNLDAVREEARAEGEAAGLAAGDAAGRLEGERIGKAWAVLHILTGRGLAVTPAQRECILACRDDALLECWLTLALHAQGADALFECET